MFPTSNGTLDVDAALADVARIYRSITGRELPRNDAPVGPIPPEREPHQVAQDALEQLARMLHRNAPLAAVAPAPALPRQHPATCVAADCWEQGPTIQVLVDLPGVRREAIQLHLENGMLLIRAHRSREVPDGARPAALERPVGTLERRVQLPRGVDASSVEAELRDGVLCVKMRRTDVAAESRSIPIR